MSRTRADRIHCPCGAVLEVYVADSLNAGRHPQLRELLLARRLHLFTCGHCGQAVVVEKEMLYFDFDRCQFIGVFPTSERARARACGEQVVAAFDVALREQAPRAVAEYAKGFLVRVCFGYLAPSESANPSGLIGKRRHKETGRPPPLQGETAPGLLALAAPAGAISPIAETPIDINS